MQKTCDHCQGTDAVKIPYIVYEKAMSRSESLAKKLWITICVLIVLLVGTNIAWMVYESQFDSIDYTQDGNGINNVNLGEQRDVINYGSDSSVQAEEESVIGEGD